MKIITLYQPWASLIALGLKRYETRSWATGYRGPIAIHAGKRSMKYREESVWRRAIDLAIADERLLLPQGVPFADDLPYGAIVAVAELTAAPKMRLKSSLLGGETIVTAAQSKLERAVGDWQSGRVGWRFEQVIALPQPIPYRGAQGLRDLDPEVEQQIQRLIDEEVL
jgi:activating signal cointegrator 1